MPKIEVRIDEADADMYRRYREFNAGLENMLKAVNQSKYSNTRQGLTNKYIFQSFYDSSSYDNFQPKWERWEPTPRKSVRVVDPEEWL